MEQSLENLSKIMGVPANSITINQRPDQPHTSFQTPTGYRPDHDIRTDAVIVYSSLADRIATWKDKGYTVQTMYGFRTGDSYIKDHRDEGQTTADGTILTCGPGSYYMVPTQSRIDAAIAYYREAIKNGASMAVPEEPEFFAQAGYSESFKRAWQEHYGEPWVDPASSVEARYKSERLKAHMEWRMVKSILRDSKAQNPAVTGAVAAHSPVSYFMWNIIYPHFQVMQIPECEEMIGQVWTGTARSGCKYEGIVAERTFENGFLEYSSLYNLMRGTGKRLWFLMDPLEDNPNRSMEDYQSNYIKTLVGSLMFPGVDEFEVMPWPDRIFGRVPGEFATSIMSIVTMLGDIHNQKTFDLDAGTEGIATFVADSMGWQRAEPGRSNYDCFYGLTLPLIMKGVPVQVAQLERTPQPKYLDPYKVILLSYNIMKPMDKRYNEALANWVKAGGTLILFGGKDAYNELPEWWTKDGFQRPQDHLLQALDIELVASATVSISSEFRPIVAEPKVVTDLANRWKHVLDVSEHVLGDAVYLRIGDSLKGNGWGPQVFGAELRVDGKTVDSFEAGTPEEERHIVGNEGSTFNSEARFADGYNYWIYRFDIAGTGEACEAVPGQSRTCANSGPNTASGQPRVEVVLDMGNQFEVSAALTPPAGNRIFRAAAENGLTARRPVFEVSGLHDVTAYETNAESLYLTEGTSMSPFFEQKVGEGTVIFCGIAPSFFASSPEAADLLRDIVRYGCEKSKHPYREQHHMTVRRGRYVAARSFDKPVTIRGKYVNVLEPELAFVTNPRVEAGDLAVYADVKGMLTDRKPRVMLSSSRLEAKSESADLTSVLLSGPLGTRGVVRFSMAGKSPKSVMVLDGCEGWPLEFEQKIENGTLLISHDGLPHGVNVRVYWE